MTDHKALQIISAMVFVVVYCIYSASSISACGTLFNTVLGIDPSIAMIVATAIIVLYTFLGGFNAVCWTDFFQGLLMLAALMLCPIIAVFAMETPGFVAEGSTVLPEHYFNILSSGSLNWASIADIITGLGWGLGYFGMPHILVRYISIKSEKEMKKSQIIGCCWTTVILTTASIVGLVGREFLGDSLGDQSLVFITMVRHLFPAFLAGVFLSAIIAASMSTADSQLLASSSAFASDVYKAKIRKNASNKEIMWAGRVVVVIIAIVAFIIANSPSCEGIMALVECAWGGFGSAFGPAILLALYWKRFTYSGAVAGIVTGFAVDAVWYAILTNVTGIYEIVPGFFCGLIAAIVVSLLSKTPSQEVIAAFEMAKQPIDTAD
jgi:sodium/proline symporter